MEEVQQLLAVPDDATAEGLRDRAVLEAFYGTGLRRQECHQLDVADRDLERGVMHLNGKGGFGRCVPMGDSLVELLQRYMHDSRPQLFSGELRRFVPPGPVQRDEAALFLSSQGTLYSKESIVRLLVVTAGRAGLGRISPHQLRHAFATHMLEGGADFISLQRMLGHRVLANTATYAHVSARELAEVHRATHRGRAAVLREL
jgi:integrase/recombinase XerD